MKQLRGTAAAGAIRRRRDDPSDHGGSHHHHHSHHHSEFSFLSHRFRDREPSESSVSTDAEEAWDRQCHTVSMITKSKEFSLVVAGMILLNIVVMASEVNYQDLYLTESCSEEMHELRMAAAERMMIAKELIRAWDEKQETLLEKARKNEQKLRHKVLKRRILTVEGFPPMRSFLDGSYRERLLPEYKLGNKTTFWEPFGERYIFYCPSRDTWCVGDIDWWQENREGKCHSSATTDPGAKIEVGNFMITWYGDHGTRRPANASIVNITLEEKLVPEAWIEQVVVKTSETPTTTQLPVPPGKYAHLLREVPVDSEGINSFDLNNFIKTAAKNKGCHPVWRFANLGFLLFFMTELVFRLITFRWKFFRNEDWAWNIFDFCIVALGTVTFVVRRVVSAGASSRLITIVRLVRILRILRVLRLFKQFRKLTMLVRGLIESLTIVFWIGALMLLIILLYAIMCTTFIGDEADDFEDPEEVRMYFGSITNSTVTLFQFLTLDNWSGITRMVWSHSPLLLPLFLVYVLIVSLVVVSLLTGVMAEHMNTVRESEEAKEEFERQKELGTVSEVFEKAFVRVDGDGNSLINPEEFAILLKDKKLVETLKDLQLDLSVIGGQNDLSSQDHTELARELFRCLDRDNDGQVTWDEFKDSLEELRKPMGSTQVFKLQGHITRVTAHQDLQDEDVVLDGGRRRPQRQRLMTSHVNDKIHKVADTIANIEHRLANFEPEMQDFLRFVRARQDPDAAG